MKAPIKPKAPMPDAEDASEAPETPGEAPDAEDQAEGPEEGGFINGAQGGEGKHPEFVKMQEASPEEQDQYDQIVRAAQGMMYSETGQSVIVKKLSATGKPEQDIGHAAAMIALSIKGGIEKEGGQIPDEVMLYAGAEIVAELGEIAEAAHIIPKFTEDVFKKSMFFAMQFFGQGVINAGGFNGKAQAQAQLQIAQLAKQVGATIGPGNVAGQKQPPQQQPAQQPEQPPANLNQAMGA